MKLFGKWMLVLLALIGILILWGVAIEPRFILDQNTEAAPIPGLPEEWVNREVAFISDTQIGIWLANEGMAHRAVHEIVQRKPSAVFLGGDFLYHPTDEDQKEAEAESSSAEFDSEVGKQIEKTLSIIEPLLGAKLPTYAVLGNHDYLLGGRSALPMKSVADRLAQSLEDAGVIVLRNEAVPLPSPLNASAASSLYIGGVDSYAANEANVDKTLAAIPDGAPRIILIHNPELIEQFPAGSAPLAIAGHTHGGQVRIPFLKKWAWMEITSNDEVHADGWATDYGAPENRIYVNRGIGFSIAPVRINCPPEVTYFRLHPETQTETETESSKKFKGGPP